MEEHILHARNVFWEAVMFDIIGEPQGGYPGIRRFFFTTPIP